MSVCIQMMNVCRELGDLWHKVEYCTALQKGWSAYTDTEWFFKIILLVK